MHQVAFHIGSKPIHWYGVCIAIGFLAALGILVWKRRHANMTKDQIFDMAMLALFCGILGARAFYVIEFWKENFAGRSFWKIFRIDEGGLVFYGGFILALIAVCVYAKLKKLSIPLILDIAAPAMALAHAFGRVGCLLQGCCFGKPVSDGGSCGIVFPQNSRPAGRFPDITANGVSLPLHPVQIYEAVLNVILCVLLLLMFRYSKKAGQVASVYLICYAVMRFSLEFFRGDHTDSIAGFTPSQAIALVILPLGIALFAYFTKKSKMIGDENADA